MRTPQRGPRGSLKEGTALDFPLLDTNPREAGREVQSMFQRMWEGATRREDLRRCSEPLAASLSPRPGSHRRRLRLRTPIRIRFEIWLRVR